jgi:WD40 repeat protein
VVEVYNISLAYNIALPYNISLAYKYSLVWTPDDTRLLSGSRSDPTIRAWGTSTWKQVGDPCTGHTGYIYAFAVNATGALVASASPSRDNHVRLWRLPDRRTIAVFKHSKPVSCATFSADRRGRFSMRGRSDGSCCQVH